MISIEVLQEIFNLSNILMMNVGVAVGVIIGALPGMTVILAITVLLPFTFGMESTTGMFLLLGAMCGGIYGGSITSILINTPGSPNNVATAFDGYELTKKGRAGDALQAALVASTVGGLISSAALVFCAPMIADLALEIGPAEYFSLCIFGLCTVVGISGGSLGKSMIMAILGVLLSTVGIDAVSGISRFRFGRSELLSGLNMTAVMLGAFAVSEILLKCTQKEEKTDIELEFVDATMSVASMMKHWWLMVKNSILGVVIGAIPGAGAGIAAYFGYNISKATAKNSEEYGTGCIEGVLAPEAANNGASAATLIPLLTLGIPGGPAAAVLLGALTMQGITPGPMLFSEDKFWVGCIMLGFFVINIFMYIQGRFFVKAFANFTKIPQVVMIPGIMLFTVLGGFAIRNSMFDVGVMLGTGFFAYLLRKNKYPVPSMSIGLALGALCETNLRRAMTISKGEISIFFTEPISLVFLILSVISIGFPLVKGFMDQKKVKVV